MKNKEVADLLKQNAEAATILHYNSVHDNDFPHAIDKQLIVDTVNRLSIIVETLIQQENDTPTS